MLLFTDATLAQRRSYMEGVLNGGVMDAIIQTWSETPAQLAVAGPHSQYQIYRALGESFPQLTITEVPQDPSIPFSVEGLFRLLQEDRAASKPMDCAVDRALRAIERGGAGAAKA